MTWTADQQRDLAQEILGTWPAAASTMGQRGLAAYVAALEARGLGFDAVVAAVRTWPPSRDEFPPSVPNLAAKALEDPSAPTFEEALRLIRQAVRAANRPLRGEYATEAQLVGARLHMIAEAAAEMHPLVASFVGRRDLQGLARLRDDVADLGGEHGMHRRRELELAWREHCDAMAGRERAMLVGRSGRGSLAQLDPLAVIGSGPRREIEAGASS